MFTNNYNADQEGESDSSPLTFKTRRNNKQQEGEGGSLVDFGKKSGIWHWALSTGTFMISKQQEGVI